MHIIEAWSIQDYCMFELTRIYNDFPNTPIEKLIDESTWYDEERKKYILEILEELLEALEVTWDDKTTTEQFRDYLLTNKQWK